jgi:aromatic-amino-acid transaminase
MELLPRSRAGRAGDDPIFALNREAASRKAKGEPIVNATVGALLDDDGKLAVMGVVPDVLREVPQEVSAAYAPIAGPPDFLRAVVTDLLGAREAAAWAVAVATPGGSGAVRHAIANFLEPQQTLLTTSLYWGPYRTMADELDRNLMTFRMFNDQGRFDVDDMAGKLSSILDTQGRALVLLNSPCHNPSGYSLDAADLDRAVGVLERAAASGPVAVLVDVAYARYGAANLDGTIDAILRLAGKAMVLFAWSASKTFTQYGLRVGALVVVHPDEGVRRAAEGALAFSSRGTWSTCNSAGMAAVTRVLTDPELRDRADRERAALRGLIEKRAAAWNALAGPAGLRYPRFDGGFFTTVLCDDPADVAARLKEDGLFVVPIQGGLRVALCSVNERDLPRLVEGIAKRMRK